MFIITILSATATAGQPVILIVGDSLSAGHGIAIEQSWPALLGKKLQAEHYPFSVANISVSGETTQGGLARLAPALKQHQPAIVIVELGANDGLRGLALEQMRGNLMSMVRQSQDIHARVLLVGMRLPPNYGPDYEQKFEQVYAEVAKQQKIPLMPFLFEGFAERREAFIDGLHPTAATQPLLLDNVWRGLQPLLRKP
jgi:acyl-CoA thioesterase-1